MYLATASLIEINGTWLLEVASFLVMLAVLWRWVYPRIAEAAQRRQKIIEDQLAQAETAAKEAEERLKAAEAKLNDARAQAQEIIAGAARSAEQLREELKAKGEEEARRQVEKAVKDIGAARQQAVESVRAQVADIVIAVTEKVVGDALDVKGHKRLIDRAIEEIGVGGKR